MLKFEETKLDLDDILIEPMVRTLVDSRSKVNPFTKDGTLPLITAPMDTVVSYENAYIFHSNKIQVCLPRGFKPEKCINYKKMSGVFFSVSLKEFEEVFLENTIEVEDDNKVHVLIDISNGHMKSLLNATQKAKEKYRNRLCIMVGNIANPKKYAAL